MEHAELGPHTESHRAPRGAVAGAPPQHAAAGDGADRTAEEKVGVHPAAIAGRERYLGGQTAQLMLGLQRSAGNAAAVRAYGRPRPTTGAPPVARRTSTPTPHTPAPSRTPLTSTPTSPSTGPAAQSAAELEPAQEVEPAAEVKQARDVEPPPEVMPAQETQPARDGTTLRVVVTPPAPVSAGPAVQRAGDEPDEGLLAGLRRRIGGVSSSLQSGWSTVSGIADAAVSALRSGGSAALESVRGIGEGVASAARAGWTTASGAVTAARTAAERAIGSAVTGVVGAFARAKAAMTALDPDGLLGAWAGVESVLSGAVSGALGVGRALTEQISSLWTGVQSGFTRVMDEARRRANGLVDGLVGLAGGAMDRAAGLWRGLTETASDLAGIGGGAARLVMRLLRPVLSAAQGLWGSLQERWASARRAASGVLDQVTTAARGAWDAAARSASGVLDGIRSAWSSARSAAAGAVERLTGGIRSTWQRFRGFSIGGVVAKMRKSVGALRLIEEAAADPDAVIEPYAAPLAARLSGGMPGAAEAAVQQHVAATGSGQTRPPASALPVQRQESEVSDGRSTSSAAEVWAGLKVAFEDKWAQLDVKKMVVDTLKSIVWPWPKVWEEMKGIGSDMATAAGTLYAPRSPITDPLRCLHDLWSNLLKLLDFPLILWRRLNNIALLLLGWVTIALTIIGFVGGSVAGTVLGAIAGALAGLGIGAAPGAGGGLAVGGAAGAGAGFGVAMALGQAFLYSFIAGETTALLKVLADLFTSRQTRDEKAADYSTAADSGLALGITGILLLAGWVGGRIAAAAAAVIRRFIPRSVLAVIDQFAEGVKTARRGPNDPKPEDNVPVEVPGKARLKTDIAGSRRFAERIRSALDKIERPDARPDLEARLRAAEERLARLDGDLDRAATAGDVERLRAERDAVQSDLQRLNGEVNAAAARFPASWGDFDERFHLEFEERLKQFRGTNDAEPNPGLRGGEGQLFLGRDPVQALKRWFKARLGDMAQSIRLLREARAGVQGNSRLARVMEVVEVTEVGSDWARRGFDPNSIPLRNALGDPAAAAARAEALAALEPPGNATMSALRDKLLSNSANLHWSPAKGKIVVIDMQ